MRLLNTPVHEVLLPAISVTAKQSSPHCSALSRSPAYHCAACSHGFAPLDHHLQLCAGSVSAGLEELLALLGTRIASRVRLPIDLWTEHAQHVRPQWTSGQQAALARAAHDMRRIISTVITAAHDVEAAQRC